MAFDTRPLAVPTHTSFPTETEFRGWLQAKDPLELVGFAYMSRRCPLARHLKEAAGFPDPGVVTRNWYADWSDAGGCRRSLPEWAVNFVTCLDSMYGEMDEDMNVTARTALMALDTAGRIA